MTGEAVCVVMWPSAQHVILGAQMTLKMMPDDNGPK
jgi:hypothetical protein